MSSFAGIDWASEEHACCVLDADGRIIDGRRYRHDERGIRALCAHLLERGVLLVAVERPDGLLIERLLDAGLHVIAIHPNQVAAMRPRFTNAGGKSDSFDAFVLAELARTDSHRFRILVPDCDATKALRALTRARENLVETRVALANTLRAQLECFWPGAVAIFADIDSPIALAFLRRYPSPADARGLGEQRLERFLARNHYAGRRPARELLARLRGAADGRAGTLETEARRQIVLGLVAALEPLVAQIAQLTSEIRSALTDHADGEIFSSLFRDPKTAICPATILAEMGDCRAPLPDQGRAGRRQRTSASRRGVRQIQASPLPLGLRPPPARRDRHARRHQPPHQPLGRRHLRPRPRPRRHPPTRDPHPRPRLVRRHLAHLARPQPLRPHPTPSPPTLLATKG